MWFFPIFNNLKILKKGNNRTYGWGSNICGELGLGHTFKYIQDPTLISSLQNVKILLLNSDYLRGEWSYKKHHLFLNEIQNEIFTVLLLSLLNPITKYPRHPNCLLYILPKEIKFELIKFIARENYWF